MNQQLTGYPSIDKPWTKYYTQEEKTLQIPEGSMFDYLYERNKDYPDDIAMEYYGHRYTFKDLFHLIDRCCRNLSALHIGIGDIVTVQAISIPQSIILIYALNKLGACGNMLYPDAKATDVISSMENTQSKLLIVVDKIFEKYENDLPVDLGNTVILMNVAEEMSFLPRLIARKKAAYTRKNPGITAISWSQFMQGEGTAYAVSHDSQIPAFMLRTGGTTGIPKEVVLSSRNFNAVAEGTFYTKLCPKWERQKVYLLLLPPFIAFGIGSGIHHSLSFGTKLVISLDVSPSAISALFLRYKPNYVVAGTVQIEQLMIDLKNKKSDLHHIDLLAVGGEAMSSGFEDSLKEFLAEHRSNVIPIKGYGLTETAATVVAETIYANKKSSVGIPLAVCNMKVVDPDTGEELTYNKQGEICLSSPGVMQEYYKNPEATSDIIETIDGVRWLHTGDIGEISEDGLLTITGRIKRIIVCKEGIVYHKVFPQLLEDQFSKIPGVKEISIVGRNDPDTGNALVAFVVSDAGVDFGSVKKKLTEFAGQKLERFERPVEYVCMKELPRTLIGKVDFRNLEKQAAEAL